MLVDWWALGRSDNRYPETDINHESVPKGQCVVHQKSLDSVVAKGAAIIARGIFIPVHDVASTLHPLLFVFNYSCVTMKRCWYTYK